MTRPESLGANSGRQLCTCSWHDRLCIHREQCWGCGAADGTCVRLCIKRTTVREHAPQRGGHPGMTSASYASALTASHDWLSANLCPGFSEYVCAPCGRHSSVVCGRDQGPCMERG